MTTTHTAAVLVRFFLCCSIAAKAVSGLDIVLWSVKTHLPTTTVQKHAITPKDTSGSISVYYFRSPSKDNCPEINVDESQQLNQPGDITTKQDDSHTVYYVLDTTTKFDMAKLPSDVWTQGQSSFDICCRFGILVGGSASGQVFTEANMVGMRIEVTNDTVFPSPNGAVVFYNQTGSYDGSGGRERAFVGATSWMVMSIAVAGTFVTSMV